MKTNVFDLLKERGYLEQATHEYELRELFSKDEPITFYIGMDGTADSLHLGHLVQIMVIMNMQRAGHKPIVLLGGGTTQIGDPSGRNDMRKLMGTSDIDENLVRFKDQVSRFIDFSDDKALLLNNADWLNELSFLPFVRDIGVHFSVNRMLSFDAYKNRIDSGLTFFEFSYMLMQSYDFLHLFREYGCNLQFGGNDQWANIISGAELIKKVEDEQAYAMTFKLLTTADGIKMGKSMKGALWLDKDKTSPYEFYQYLRNCDDRDVIKFMKVLTFIPMDEIRELEKLEGQEINKAKEILAFETTKIVHGEEAAKNAQEASHKLFEEGIQSESLPTTEFNSSEFSEGMGLLNLLTTIGLTKSNGEARSLIQQGGILVNDVKVEEANRTITLEDFTDNKLLIKKGRKTYHQIIVK